MRSAVATSDIGGVPRLQSAAHDDSINPQCTGKASMKRHLIRITVATVVMLTASPMLRAADDQRLAALKSADDERVAATLAADRPRLTAIFSDDLRYTHSTGGVDTKASLIDAITAGKT